MSQDAPVTAPAASLFQKAYSQMVLQQRLDTQLAALLEQRRKAQEELEATQIQINEEFERLKRDSEEAPVRLMNTIAKMGASAAAAEQLSSSMTSLHSLREEATRSGLRGNGGSSDSHKSRESREEAESAT